MCRGTAMYYLKCGHSAVVWERCDRARTPFCHPTQAGEAYRDDRCNHRWCPCDNRVWACCRCTRLNLWADCASCGHLRCALCRAGATGEAFGVANFQDLRYTQWRRRQLEHEARLRAQRAQQRAQHASPSGSGSGGERGERGGQDG